MGRLYKCWNPKCADGPKPGHDFEGEDAAGTCPKCGIVSTDPRFGRFIVQRVVVHFDAPSGVVDGVGVGHAACDTSRKTGVYRCTGEPAAVSCPACKQTEAFKAADRALAVHPDHDVPLVIDPAKQVITLAK